MNQVEKQGNTYRAKTYSYLTEDNEQRKKAKIIIKYVIKRKPKFKDVEKFLQAFQLENQMIYLNIDKIDVKRYIEKH